MSTEIITIRKQICELCLELIHAGTLLWSSEMKHK